MGANVSARVRGVAGCVVVALAAVAACSSRAYLCDADPQCDPGVCVEGSCAFEDADCVSGLRYGEASGSLSKTCVGVGAPASSGTAGTDGVAASRGASSGSQDDGAEGDARNDGARQPDASDDGGASDTGDETTGGTGGTSTGSPGPDGLVAWFTADVDASMEATDHSGNGHHASCEACPTLGPGVDGNAWRFDGETQQLSVDHMQAWALDTFTLAAWVHASAPAGDGFAFVVGKPVGDGTLNSWEIGLDLDQATVVGCWGSATDAECVDAPVAFEAWVHVALSFDGEVGRLWLDGTPVADRAVLPANGLGYDQSPVLIGADSDFDQAQHWFQGRLDDIRVYDRALTGDELAELAIAL